MSEVTDDQCNLCRFNRSYIEDITVDGRIVDQWYEFACEREGDLTDEIMGEVNEGRCPFFARCTQQEVKE